MSTHHFYDFLDFSFKAAGVLRENWAFKKNVLDLITLENYYSG